MNTQKDIEEAIICFEKICESCSNSDAYYIDEESYNMIMKILKISPTDYLKCKNGEQK